MKSLGDVSRTIVLLLVTASTACVHPGPVVGGTETEVGGTIAGTVSGTERTVALPGRKVTVVNATSGTSYEATTAANGGYTIKVPEGDYRIDIELHQGETLAKRPADTHVNNGDLDARRDFVVTASR